MRLDGRRAFVTGAGSGIGQAIAQLFSREGAIVGVADINRDAATAVATAIREQGGLAEPYIVDISDPESVRHALQAFFKAHNGIDVLVNNAGIVVGGTAGDTTDLDWRRNIDVNLAGAFHCCREALGAMVRQGSGAIVSVSSTSAFHPVHERAAYAAAKAGVYALTRSIAFDYASYGIRANAIAPGAVSTPLLQGRVRDPEIRRAALSSIPLGRFGDPEELARAALFLASDDSSYVTGHLLVVDGGATIP